MKIKNKKPCNSLENKIGIIYMQSKNIFIFKFILSYIKDMDFEWWKDSVFHLRL